MRRALITGLASLAVVIVAALVAVPILIHRNLSVAAVEQRATDLLGREVTVAEVGITFRPGLRIRAEGVAIAGGDSAEAVEVEIAVLPLLQRRVEPAELHLQRPRLLADRDAKGRLSLRFLSNREATTPSDSGFPPLPALAARDGEILLLDPGGRLEDAPRLRILRFEQAALGRDGRAPTKLHIALDPGDRSSFSFEEARLAAFLERVDGEVRVTSGRLEGRGLRVKKLRFPRFEGAFGYAAGRIDIDGLEAVGYDGRARLDGAIVTARPVRYEGKVRIEGLAIPPMVEDVRGAPPNAVPQTLDLAGEVAVRLGGGLRGTGSGAFSVRGGTLPTGSLFSALLGSIGSLSGQILSFGSAGAPSPSEVERIEGDWVLRQDRLHSDAIVMVTDDYRYDAAGSLGFDQSLRFQGSLQLTSRGAQRMVASAALPLPGATAVIPSFPVAVAGGLGAPAVNAELGGLPGVAKSSLSALVGGGVGVVKGAARVGKGAARVGKGALGRIFGRGDDADAEGDPPEN